MYEFSIPMPLALNGLNFILSLNKKLKKSKITSVYFALPNTDSDRTGFEQNRVGLPIKTNFLYWKPIFEKVKENNIELIYLLNSPKSMPIESDNFHIQIEKLDKLILNLKSVECYSLRISSIQLLDYLLKKYPEMNYYTSTSFEWNQFKQYNNFLQTFPQTKQIVPSYNINKNFKLLKNLKKNFPNIDIELMVNEGCIAGCPFRNEHNISIPTIVKKDFVPFDETFTMKCFIDKCTAIHRKNRYKSICISNLIYPWEIEEYAKIGINKFKLVGRNCSTFINGKYLKIYEQYLIGIENYKYIENLDYKILNHYMVECDFKASIKEVRPYLPNIKHFIKYGHLCSSICEYECNYCIKCAEKLKKALESK